MVARGLVALVALLALSSAAAAAKAPYAVELKTFSFATGTKAGTTAAGGALTLASSGLGSLSYTDPHGYGTTTYDTGTWTSDWHEPGFAFAQAVPSWNASTPPGTWIQVELRARTPDGGETKWYVLGRWASGDADFHRTSVPAQGDKDGFVAIDTFIPKRALPAYQLRLTLLRASGSAASPSVTRLSNVAANDASPYEPSETTMDEEIVLDVPEYSQEIHAGHYPEFDGGGEAWCSPTSTSMILAYWGRGPTAADYAYVTAADPGHPDPWVDYAARYTYDFNYQGAGNWPFNIAYAARFGLEGAVTQLRSLAEAETVHQGRHPSRRLALVRLGEARRLPLQEHERPPAHDRRLHRRRERRLERPRRPHRRGRPARVRPGAVRGRVDELDRRARLPAVSAGDAAPAEPGEW